MENNFEDYIADKLKELYEEIIPFIESEIDKKELIQFKGYFDVKSFFKATFDKFKNLFNNNDSQAKVDVFVNDHYMQGIEQVEKELNKNLIGVKITTNELGKLIQTDSFKESLMDDLKYLNERLVEKVRQEVTQGILNGFTLIQIKKNIREIFEKELNNSQMIAEGNARAIIAKGRFHTIKSMDENYKKFISIHLDNRTSNICKTLNAKYGRPEDAISFNQKFKTSDGEWMTEPFHFNCRSRVLYILSTDIKK